MALGRRGEEATGGLERARARASQRHDLLHPWETLAERRTREAIEAGEFDNLPGKGRPLPDEPENPFEDPTARLGYRLLRNNGFSLPWIERGRDLERERATLISTLEHAIERMGRGLRTRRDELHRQATDAFQRNAADLNRRIRGHNLAIPVSGMAVRLVDVDAEVRRCGRVGPKDDPRR